jgi:hypothetical protein
VARVDADRRAAFTPLRAAQLNKRAGDFTRRLFLDREAGGSPRAVSGLRWKRCKDEKSRKRKFRLVGSFGA